MISDSMNILKNMKSYRGEIFKVISIDGRKSISYDPFRYDEDDPYSRIPEILGYFGISHLYKYQGDILNEVLNGKSIGLFAPVGSGKKTTIAAATALSAIYTGKTTLIICENEAEAGIFEDMFAGRIGDFVKIHRHDRQHTALNLACDILITTDTQIKKLLFSAYDKIREWASMLGYIVISSLTSFSVSRIGHIQGLIAFFDNAVGKGSRLSYLISGEPIGNPMSVVTELTGRKDDAGISLYSDLGKSKESYDIIAWLPAYSISQQDDNVSVVREDYDKDLGAFLKLFKDKSHVLIWHAYASIGKDKLQAWIDPYRFTAKVTLISKLSEIQLSKTGLFDGLILMGFPKNPRAVIETLGNILIKDSTVGFILPNDPFSHFLLKTSDSFVDYPAPDFIVPKSGSFIASAYLFLCAFLSKLDKLRKADLTSGQLAGVLKNKMMLIRAGFLLYEEDDGFALNIDSLKHRTKEWFLESRTPDIMSIRIDEKVRYFDKYLFPQTLFPGAIKHFEDIPYQLIKEDGGFVFTPISGVAPVKRTPLLQYEIMETKELDAFKGKFTIALAEAKIRVSWNGYKEYRSFTSSPKEAFIIETSIAEHYHKETYLLRISGLGIPHGMAHLLRLWIPLFLTNFFDYYEIFHDSENLYFYSHISNESEARDLLLNQPAVLGKAFQYSKDLLLHACPCKAGCPFCLESLDCSSRDESIDKKQTLLRIHELLGEIPGDLIRLKYDGLAAATAQKHYERIAQKVILVFEMKLDLFINNRVPIIAVKKNSISKAGCSGVFTGDRVEVLEGLDEARATEIIAHEYAHNWAAENMTAIEETPTDMPDDQTIKEILSKLISEGFAQWVAFKIMDYFGLESSMTGIYLWDFDEYGEGFRVLNWLENRMGFMAVMNFARKGSTEGYDGEEWGLNALLEKSGFKARVLNWAVNKKTPSRKAKG